MEYFMRCNMVKDIIKYNEKEYQLSSVFIEKMGLFETMIFPIENGIISGSEVFCYRTHYLELANEVYTRIKLYPEKYLSDKAIEKYFACKKCEEWCCTMCKYFG